MQAKPFYTEKVNMKQVKVNQSKDCPFAELDDMGIVNLISKTYDRLKEQHPAMSALFEVD